MSPERIGHVEGGTFVDEREGNNPGEGKGFADPVEVEVKRRLEESDRAANEARVDEAIEHLEHVLASITPDELTWAQLTRLTEVNERLLEVYKWGLIAQLKAQTRDG